MKNHYTIQNNIVQIKLTQGQLTLIDKNDLPLISPYRWFTSKGWNTYYALSHIRHPNGYWTKIKIHRLLLNLQFNHPKKEVDHIDGDGLNNTRKNLRIVDRAGNQRNRHGKEPHKIGETPTSQYPGVRWHKYTHKWQARIMNHGVCIYLGYWHREFDAANVYRLAKIIRDIGGTNQEIKNTKNWELTFAGSSPNEVANHAKKITNSVIEAKKQLDNQNN